MVGDERRPVDNGEFIPDENDPEFDHDGLDDVNVDWGSITREPVCSLRKSRMQTSMLIASSMSVLSLTIRSSSNMNVSGTRSATLEGMMRLANPRKNTAISPSDLGDAEPENAEAWNHAWAYVMSILRMAIFFKKNVCSNSTVS